MSSSQADARPSVPIPVDGAAPLALHRALDRFYVGFLEVFVYSSVWVAGALASLALVTGHVLNHPWDPRPALLIFFSGLFIYNLDHVSDARVEGIPDERAQAYFKRPAVLLLMVGAAIATGLMISTASQAARWVFGAYVCLGLLYGIPVIPIPRAGGLRWYRLKEIPGIKAWLVAATIVVAALGLPLAWHNLPLDLPAWHLAVFLLVFSASGCHMFDIRDMKSDAAAGVRSLPIQTSVRATKLALIALNLVMLLVMFWGWTSGISGPHPEIVACTAITVLYVLLINTDTPREVYSILVDGCFFLPALLALLHEGLA